MTKKKIDKEFCFTDETVNVYGYRCLTSGLQLDEVKKNPIGYFMHNRDNGVVVKWEDFRIEGSKVFAKPVINLSHPDGQRIADQVENGFLNGASAGKIVVLDASEERNLMIPGQTKPTVTKWFPREISLVDIPGNYNALANLFDVNNNPLNLADFSKSTNAIKKSSDLDESKKSSVNSEVEAILNKGITNKKLTQNVANELKRSYANSPESLKSLIESMPYLGIPNDLQNKTWDQLYASDKLELVRTKHPELYEKLKDEKYPKNKKSENESVPSLEPPSDLQNKTWDQLYASDKLELVRTKYPAFYEKLKNEKYPKK